MKFVTQTHEYWIGDFVIYLTPLGWKSFKLGFIIGRENTIYLGVYCFGIDYWGK